MTELKKHLIKLMEDVEPGYQAPFEPNSGQGITKFAPTPASKVLKSYQVDGDFLRKAIGFGGVAPELVDQIMGGLDGQQCDGPFCGSHFDTVAGGLGGMAPTGEPVGAPPVASPVGGVPVPPVGSAPGMATDTTPPAEPVMAEPEAPLATPGDVDMSAGQVAVPGAGEVAAVVGDALAGGAGDVVNGEPVSPETPPEGVEPAEGVEDEEEAGEAPISQ